MVVGGVAAVLVFRSSFLTPAEPAFGASNRQAAAEFAERWEKWRRATAVFTETTERSSGEQRLSEEARIAQRFPDRVVRVGGDVSARIGGRLVGCSEATASAEALCVDNGGYEPDRELGLELDEITELTTGEAPRYRVSFLPDAGCFRLRHMVTEFRPYWGDQADICFDTTTGVVLSETTITGDLTVSVVRDEITGTVTDDDLALPASVTTG